MSIPRTKDNTHPSLMYPISRPRAQMSWPYPPRLQPLRPVWHPRITARPGVRLGGAGPGEECGNWYQFCTSIGFTCQPDSSAESKKRCKPREDCGIGRFCPSGMTCTDGKCVPKSGGRTLKPRNAVVSRASTRRVELMGPRVAGKTRSSRKDGCSKQTKKKPGASCKRIVEGQSKTGECLLKRTGRRVCKTNLNRKR